VITFQNVWKRYHTYRADDWVLRNVNLNIPRNVSVGVVGSNGAGKSTLLRLIGDMDSPERGRIHRGCRVSWPIGLRSGLQPTLTGRQNIKFVARVHGDDSDIADIIAFVEDFAEIGKAIDLPIKTYSSGMRARLSFGLSFAFDFDVYLSDEATAVGDISFRKKAISAFKERVGTSSLIMVSHQEKIMRELCQAGVYLDRGEAHWFDDISEALRVYYRDYSITPQRKGRRRKQVSTPPESVNQ
jgi:capsular polysaccharide transport system ATP-binding protein